MKRFVILALPFLATAVVLGVGFYLFRTQGDAIKPRLDSLRHAVGEAVEEFTEELTEEKKV